MTSHIFSIICCCSATWNLFYALNTMCNPLQVDQRQRDGKEKIWKLEGFILYIIFSVLSYLSNIVSIFFINLQQRHITQDKPIWFLSGFLHFHIFARCLSNFYSPYIIINLKNLNSFKYSSTTITLYQTTITNNDSNTDIYHTYTNCYQREDILDMTSLKIYVRIIPCTLLATMYFTTPSLDC